MCNPFLHSFPSSLLCPFKLPFSPFCLSSLAFPCFCLFPFFLSFFLFLYPLQCEGQLLLLLLPLHALIACTHKP